jgi:predicted aconitase with swiveling domain
MHSIGARGPGGAALSDAISAATLAPGRAQGAPLRLDEALSFWGGLDPLTGRIIDRWHPQAGELIKDRILMMPAGRGSSSGSAALAEALRLGVGPAAILLLKRDAIVIVGALAAMELYGRPCPVALAAAEDWARLAAARWLDVCADARHTQIRELAA